VKNRLRERPVLFCIDTHDYGPEQMAFDGGLMDLFPANTGTAGPPPSAPPQQVLTTGLTMGRRKHRYCTVELRPVFRDE
jgi:hypothetical protein